MSSAYDTLILGTANLLAFWPMNDLGATAADASGNGHTLTLPSGVNTGVASLLSRDNETAMQWTNTVAAEGSVATPATLAGTTPAVEWWYKPAVLSGGNQHDIRASGAGTGWGAGMKAGSGFLFTTFGHADNVFAALPVAGTVYYVVMQLDGSGNLSLYLNGALQQTLTGVAITSGSTAAGIGGMSADSDFFQGVIQKPAMYSAPLTAGQISAHYAAGAAGGLLLRKVNT